MTELETKIAEADCALAMLTHAVAGTADDYVLSAEYLSNELERTREAYDRLYDYFMALSREYQRLGGQYERLYLATTTSSWTVH